MFIVASMALSAAALPLAAVLVLRGSFDGRDLVILLVSSMVTGYGVELGFHRLITHRAFRTAPAVRVGLAIAGSMAGQGPVVAWASVHRLHHQRTDVPGDPHSPNLEPSGSRGRGLWHAHFGWQFNDELPNAGVYAKDLLRDRALNRVNRLYTVWLAVGLLVPAVVGWAWIGGWGGLARGFVWGGLVRWLLSTNLPYAVNSVCHTFGRRPFAADDRSANVAVLAIPTFGAAWHNDHHAFPRSAVVGFGRGQLDPSGGAVKLLARVGLAHDVIRPTPDQVRAKRAEEAGP